MADSGRMIQPTVLSKWMRGLLLALLLIALGGFNIFMNPFGLPIETASEDEGWQEFVFLACMGIIFIQPMVLAVWMAFANVPPGKRVSIGLTILMWLCATAAVGIYIVETEVSQEVVSATFMLPIQLAVLFPVLATARHWTRWRVAMFSGAPVVQAASGQFGIAAIMIWTLQFGVLVGGLNFLYRQSPQSAGSGFAPLASAPEAVLGATLFSLPALAAAWMVLGRGKTVVVGAAATVISSCVVGAILLAITGVTSGEPLLEEIVQIAIPLSGMVVGAAFVFFTLRGMGYRMVRVEKGPQAKVAAETLNSGQPVPAFCHKLRWQFAMATLLVVAVCASIGWRAKEVIPQRLRDAEQSHLRNLGFSVHQEGSAVVGLAPKPDQPLTDAHLDSIQQLDTVPILNLAAVPSPTQQLSVLCQLPQAKNLFLYQSGVSDSDLAYVGKMTGLEVLNISNTKITDAGIAELAKLTNLQQLVASSTVITDAGLAHLHGLKALRVVELYSTGVTADGVQKLQEALPKVSVRWQ
jgi:hypothetical protein